MTRHSLLLWLLALAVVGVPGCRNGGDDDTSADDDDTGDDDTTGDDDYTPEDPCLDTPNGSDLDGTVCGSDAACRSAEISTATYLGYSVTGGFDFDADGVEDLVAGAPGWDVAQDEGRALIYTAASFDQPIFGPVAYVEGPDPLENAGFTVSLIPDTDGDGTGDLLVGARSDTEGGTAAGAVYLVHGRALAGDTATPENLAIDTAVRGASEYSRVGTSVTGIPDVTGDALGEFALGFELYTESSGWEFADDGKVGVFHGSTGGLTSELSVDDADLIFEGPLGGYHVGLSLDGAGDVTGDGLADLLVGAPDANGSRGRVYILTGPDLSEAGTYAIEDVAVMVEGEEAGESLGTSVVFLGDVDGDGLGDLATGSPDGDVPWTDGGIVTLYSGTADIDAGVAPEILARFGSEWDDFMFGGALAGNTDLDGDGLMDLVVGAHYAYLGPVMKGGRAYLFHGRTTGWDTLADATEADASVAGIGVGDNLGLGLTLSDLDGDGFDEVLLGAPYRDAMGSDSGELYLFWGPSR
jgi:hypothetical protein